MVGGVPAGPCFNRGGKAGTSCGVIKSSTLAALEVVFDSTGSVCLIVTNSLSEFAEEKHVYLAKTTCICLLINQRNDHG